MAGLLNEEDFSDSKARNWRKCRRHYWWGKYGAWNELGDQLGRSRERVRQERKKRGLRSPLARKGKEPNEAQTER